MTQLKKDESFVRKQFCFNLKLHVVTIRDKVLEQNEWLIKTYASKKNMTTASILYVLFIISFGYHLYLFYGYNSTCALIGC